MGEYIWPDLIEANKGQPRVASEIAFNEHVG